MDKIEIVYDSTDIQLRELESMVGDKLTTADLATPQMVQFILNQQIQNLSDLKVVKKENNELVRTVENKVDENAQLRIQLARSTERQKILVLEIPIGVLSGIAINVLTSTHFSDPLGWVLLVLSLIMLISVGRLGSSRKAVWKDK